MSLNFADLLLPDELLRAIAKQGFAEPTPVQQQVIPPAVAGRDLLVSAATGSGKTAAFLLPMMQHLLDHPAPATATRALILVPTRELARQVRSHFLELGSYTRLQAESITGGAPLRHQIASLRRNPEILIATPGRLLELLEAGHADLSDLEVLVLDEADRMLDMGFAPDVLSIIERCRRERQSLLFSATLDHRGLAPLIERLARDPLVITATPVREQHPDIRQQVILTDSPEHKHQVLLQLLRQESYRQALVFTNTRLHTESLSGFLQNNGLRSGALHGELDQRERNRIMGLLREGRIDILVATDVAARGLDIPGVELVISYDLARSGDDHLHRSGRTGRAGEQGLSIGLVGARDWNRRISIERYLRLQFETRTLEGLEGKFRGPKRLKGSGKIAATRKRDKETPEPPKPKVKVRERDRKNIGKRRKPSGEGTPQEAGLKPLRRRNP
jgi:ATP-dependent RNA helicase SrmB